MRRDVVFVVRLDFCYAKIVNNMLIYNFLDLIYLKRNTSSAPVAASCSI